MPDTTKAKPFVKWVGGKTQLISDIQKALPSNFTSAIHTYVEPFVGGGAILFWILQNYPNIKRAVINDINPKLINVYRIIQKDPNALIAELLKLQKEYISLSHEARTEMFLSKRNQFNTSSINFIEQAALFIFLNRTCFNGLYRENAKGAFNVPHGKYTNPKICDTGTILRDSEILQRVEILCGDFSNTVSYAGKDSLFYFDPPYKPLSNTSSFNQYVKEQFNDKEQVRLRNFCNKISDYGSIFILSNSDVKSKDTANLFFDELYAEYSIRRVFATRMVNANPDKRGRLSELMISNY